MRPDQLKATLDGKPWPERAPSRDWIESECPCEVTRDDDGRIISVLVQVPDGVTVSIEVRDQGQMDHWRAGFAFADAMLDDIAREESELLDAECRREERVA